MMVKKRGYLPVFALGLLAASCGIGVPSASSSSSTTSVPTNPITTTTVDSQLSPLTGLPYSNPSDASRPAIAAKIDNAPQAWPQSGLAHSDVVYEEMVEGGFTRYMAVFQSQNAPVLGPIRSVRASDADIAAPLRGYFAYSGGIPAFVADIRNSGVVDVGANVLGGIYYRLNSRPEPHNLYTSTESIYKAASAAGLSAKLPPKLFDFRKVGSTFAAAGAQGVSSLLVNVSGNARDLWTWNPGSATWIRSTDGTLQQNAQGTPVSAQNVIVEFVSYTNTGFIDPAGNPVPQAHSVGSGNAIFLSGGKEAQGSWSKASERSVTTFSDASGQPVQLEPGRTWVMFVPIGTPTIAS